MPCFVPPQHRHLRWHVIRMCLPPEDEPSFYERAEWRNCEANGPTEGGYWIRWGGTGDFPSLCHAIYVGPALDQDSPFAVIDERLMPREVLRDGDMMDFWNQKSGAEIAEIAARTPGCRGFKGGG